MNFITKDDPDAEEIYIEDEKTYILVSKGINTIRKVQETKGGRNRQILKTYRRSKRTEALGKVVFELSYETYDS